MSIAELNIAEINDLKIFADNEKVAGRYIEGQRLHDLIASYGAAGDLEDADDKLTDLKDEKEAGCASAKAARDLARSVLVSLESHAAALDEAIVETEVAPAPIDIKTKKPKKKPSKEAAVDKQLAFVQLASVARATQQEMAKARTALEELISKLDEAVTELL